jgi:hypothetical protein
MDQFALIAIVFISDRASSGKYEYQGLPSFRPTGVVA